MFFKQLKPIILLFLVFIFSGASNRGFQEMYFYEQPYPAAKTEFFDENGNQLSISDFKGKIVLLNLWSTTCGSCLLQLPLLDQLQAKFPKSDFEVVAMNTKWNANPYELNDFFKARGIENLEVYVDSQENFYNASKAMGYPTTILIDEDSMEIARVRGISNWLSDDFLAKLEKILYEKQN